MRRRTFIGGAAGAAACVPASAWARGDTASVGVILGYLEGDREGEARLLALRTKLAALGWVAPKLRLEVRWAAGSPALRQAHAADLASLPVDVLVANSTPILRAVKAATTTVPVVFVQVADPVGDGLVQSFARPGGNITGFVDFDSGAIAGKWVELVKEAVPAIGRARILLDPNQTNHQVFVAAFKPTAESLGIALSIEPVRDGQDLARMLAGLAGPQDALVVLPGPVNNALRDQIIAGAALQRLPAMYPLGYYARAGGLMSYGPDQLDQWPRAAIYVDRILRGERPDALPVQAPTRYELIVNQRTARSQGLVLPPSLLTRADEVLE